MASNKLYMLIFILVPFVNGIYLAKNVTTSAKIKNRSDQTPAQWTEPEGGLWSDLLEEYTITIDSPDKSNRKGRLMQSNHRYIPTSNFYVTRRMGEAMEVEPQPHYRRPGPPSAPSAKVIGNVPPTLGLPMRQSHAGVMPSPREVSETDLYLLGAIEKLVYRVDYMEKRLRRTEQLLYYVMAGNTQKEEPCPENFTRVGENCYHFGSMRDVNWKSANALCKTMGSNLAELETLTENQEVVAFLLNHPTYRGKDFWLGGLNPGLLWIWANSAKPINPNTNIPSLTNTTATSTSKEEEKGHNFEITGDGRCLRLSYNPSLHTYSGYTGQECSSRHNYMCEYKDKSLDNEISRISRELNIKN